METLKAFVRGEPTTVGQLATAVAAIVGIQITDTAMSSIIAGVAALVAAFLARRATTPAANPAIPAAPRPVLTFAGTRPAPPAG